MEGLFPEVSDIVLGLLQGSGAGGVNGLPVYAGECSDITAIITLAVGTGADANNQATINIRAQSDNAGTGQEVLTFEQIFVKTGNPLLKDDPASGNAGDWTRTDYANGATSYQTVAASGNKQMRIAIPFRSRRLPKGKLYFSAHITALVAARVVGIEYIRNINSYAPGINRDLY